MRKEKSKINPCENYPASNCLFKKHLQERGQIEVKYFWQEIAGGWQKLIGGKIIKKK